MNTPIYGFSKLSRHQQIELLTHHGKLSEREAKALLSDRISIDKLSILSENVISTFSLPYSVVPNFLINGKYHIVPMVTEESSVIAGAAKAAKFWFMKGGFDSRVVNNTKVGTIYFRYNDSIDELRDKLILSSSEYISIITDSMSKRGGGLIGITVESVVGIRHIYKLKFKFDTVDSMGANFINTTLEKTMDHLRYIFRKIDFITAILSNHCPDSIVVSKVSCHIDELTYCRDISPQEFVDRFQLLVDIANTDIDRSATHNKGIMNGIDSVLMATGNDFRAVESGLSSYLRYNNIFTPSHIRLSSGEFSYSLKMPIVLGTRGGVTNYHDRAIISNKLLDYPSAIRLMEIVCSVGLASNFAAISALITTGIQGGHMKLHNRKWGSM